MRNYDFHELLSAKEFQQFAKSILEIRENKKVKSNSMNKDGGIDLYFLDENVIGQVKNYKNDASKVVSSLKKEVDRIKKLNPKRYIIITAAEINKTKREKLISMFGCFLQMEDIIDKNDLNELLNDPKYHKLEIKYLKLLVPNSFVLTHYLDSIENNKIYTATEIELDKIKEERKIFSVNEIFFEALNKLLQEKVIIITGEPGVGKSILGRMLSAYLINENSDMEFLSVANLDELFQIHKKEKGQIYFFDDFWGDSKYDFSVTEKEKDQIINFSKYIKKLKNKYLIITTREYILKDGIQLNQKLKDHYEFYKYSINLNELTKTEKFNIFVNQLKNVELSWEHLSILLKYWQTIIENENYNPRYIRIFFENYHKYNHLEAFDFIKNLIDYLNNPFSFWEDTLKDQPMEIILLLMIISLNHKEINLKELQNKYNNLINSKRIENKIPFEFKDLIKRMDNEFTITRQDETKTENIIISFKNPSYKDFIQNYLKKNMAKYISYIFNENLSLNELINLWEILNKDFQIFKDLKETKEIDMLISNQLVFQDIDTKYHYLIEAAEITDFNYESKIRNYIINFMVGSLEDFEDVMYSNSNYFQLVIALLNTLVDKYDFSKYIYNVLDSIVFGEEDLFFTEQIATIKELYPSIYNDYYQKYKSVIKNVIYYSILNNAYFYEKEQDMFSIDMLRYEEIKELYKRLNMKVPTKLLKTIDDILEKMQEQEREKEIEIPQYKKKKKTTEKIEDLEEVKETIAELIGKNEEIFDLEKTMKKWKTKEKVKKKILKVQENSLLSDLVFYEAPLRLLCEYFSEKEYIENELDLLKDLESYVFKKENFTSIETMIIYSIAHQMIINGKLVFKKDELKNYNCNMNKILKSAFFLKRGEWYHFIHPIIFLHLILISIKDYTKSSIKIENIVYRLTEPRMEWEQLGFNGFENEEILEMIEKMFPKQWEEEIREPNYNNFIKNINTKDSITIAKSILKEFNFSFHYHIDGGISYSFENLLLHSLIKMDFNIDICELFLWDMCPEDELEIFLEKYTDDGDLEVNKNLRKKGFITLLEENNILDTLNKLYWSLLQEVEKITTYNISR